MSNVDFGTNLEKVRAKTDAKQLVFYCNGKTCEKSYEACDLAQKEGFQKVAVYNAGTFDWANAQPKRAALLGETPFNPTSSLARQHSMGRMLRMTM